MQNQLEKDHPVTGEITHEFQPDRQYVLRYLTKFLGVNYLWYLIFFVIVLGLFVFSPYLGSLIGLKTLWGWNSLYYESVYRFVYQMCIAIIAWRFGMRKAIIACVVLIAVIYLPFVTGLHQGFLLIDVGLILLGLVISAVLGRQGDMARMLFKSTSELRQQTGQLKLEIAERLKAEKEIRSLSIGAIEALVSALQAKDKYSAGHSRRVTLFAMAIGNKLNLTEEDMEDLRYGSLLHDVGKIAVEQVVQNKISRLTPNEYAHIMRHVHAGADIVKPVVNRKVVELIEHHHDQYHSGNPQQIATGENIPLGARIIAVADAFDAMTSTRPYRAAMPAARAFKEIQDCKGTQFDPVVVDAFLGVPLNEIAVILENKSNS